MIQRYSRELNSDWAMVGKAVEDCMRAIIGVLLNLTHDNGTHTHTHTHTHTYYKKVPSFEWIVELFTADISSITVCTLIFVCVCRVGQYEDGRTAGFNHDGSELCSQSPSVSSTRAEVRHPSAGEYHTLSHTDGAFNPQILTLRKIY